MEAYDKLTEQAHAISQLSHHGHAGKHGTPQERKPT